MTRRGAYRSRRLETKKRDDDRRRESTIYHDEEKKNWTSLKGKQAPPSDRKRTVYIAVEEVDKETEGELERAIGGDSQRVDRYQAARIVVAQAIEKGLIKAND